MRIPFLRQTCSLPEVTKFDQLTLTLHFTSIRSLPQLSFMIGVGKYKSCGLWPTPGRPNPRITTDVISKQPAIKINKPSIRSFHQQPHLSSPIVSFSPAMSIETKATIASFGGKLLKVAHNATTTKCEMNFNLYIPPQASTDHSIKVPLLVYLAGLTCTGDNGAEKGFFQRAASQQGIAVLYPDTSPR